MISPALASRRRSLSVSGDLLDAIGEALGLERRGGRRIIIVSPAGDRLSVEDAIRTAWDVMGRRPANDVTP